MPIIFFFNLWGFDFANIWVHLCFYIRPYSFFYLCGYKGTLGCALQEGINTKHRFVLLDRHTLCK